jgi:hypothetical protein
MAKFLFVYSMGKMAATPRDQEKMMTAWNDWFKSMGKSVIDQGAPTAPGKIVSAAGVKTGMSEVGGYTIVDAKDIDAATKMAKGAPGMDQGMNVSVYPLMDMMAAAPKK